MTRRRLPIRPVLRLSFGGGFFGEPGRLHANVMAQLDAVEREAGRVSLFSGLNNLTDVTLKVVELEPESAAMAQLKAGLRRQVPGPRPTDQPDRRRVQPGGAQHRRVRGGAGVTGAAFAEPCTQPVLGVGFPDLMDGGRERGRHGGGSCIGRRSWLERAASQ